jgi:Rrf2 family iron-sulfur cluster assembly transcriptional regulator
MATHEQHNMSATYLHQKLAIPYPYLRQVLTSLSKNGFIHSTRGRSGGFTLSKQKKEISLADIIDSTEGLESLNKCILGFKECPFSEQCTMHTIWENMRASLMKILKETSLADLINNKI